MRSTLLFNACVLLCAIQAFGQADFEIKPYANGVTTVKDGNVEAGVDFEWENNGKLDQLRPHLRMPLTDKEKNLLQIDRQTDTWRFILGWMHAVDKTGTTGPIVLNAFSVQGEFGANGYKYYPTGDKEAKSKKNTTSYGGEVKYIIFRHNEKPDGNDKPWKHALQFRARYSYDWKAADEVGVVAPPNANGVTVANKMIIDAPGSTATFSPAVAWPYYRGNGNFTYAPAIYYDFTGKKNSDDAFGGVGRLRLNYWFFYHPVMDNSPNIKLGITPFVSIRTQGSDDFNEIEFGAQLSVKFGGLFYQFF